MKTGILKPGSLKLKGWRASAVELRENELVLEFTGKEKIPRRLVLQGIISAKDAGLIGKALSEFSIADKGSLKEIEFRGSKGTILMQCKYMEGEIR
jgi:hypothetical protein